MAFTPKILAFAGSTRTESFNKKTVKVAAEAARAAGAEVAIIDLRDFALPVYDGDFEAARGLPPDARKLKDIMFAHHGFLISSPEYNSSISGVLKNAIDWASRPFKGETSLQAFTGKIAGIMSASPGALGGLRGLVHLRAILGNIGVIVLPTQIAISNAGEAFNPDGLLKDAKQQATVERIAREVTEFIAKLKS